MNNLNFTVLRKLQPGAKIAILSPSYAAPGRWSHIYELGIKRLQENFGLEPVAYPTTFKLGASKQERGGDLIAAFENPAIQGVIATLGGDDQITYVKDLPDTPFRNNPKPYFGCSDNTHFMNHLWLNGIPSYYGGSLFTEFARTPRMDDFTVGYLKKALFEGGQIELTASQTFNDVGVGWDSPANLTQEKLYELSEGWQWDEKGGIFEGVTWGGCLESIDEILRHGGRLPALEQFEEIILITETSEEIPPHEYVRRVYRALGERGILSRIKGLLVGRPKAWEFGREQSPDQKAQYRQRQKEIILAIVREYNTSIPLVQNMDFGHTNPQICLPYGFPACIDANTKKVSVMF